MDKNKKIKEVVTQTTHYWREEGAEILFGEVMTKADITLEHVVENHEKRQALLPDGKPIPIVLNIKSILKISKEARKYSAETASDEFSCIAMIVDSGLSKVIGNYALFLNRPKIPTKLFNNAADAEKWVQQYLA